MITDQARRIFVAAKKKTMDGALTWAGDNLGETRSRYRADFDNYSLVVETLRAQASVLLFTRGGKSRSVQFGIRIDDEHGETIVSYSTGSGEADYDLFRDLFSLAQSATVEAQLALESLENQLEPYFRD